MTSKRHLETLERLAEEHAENWRPGSWMVVFWIKRADSYRMRRHIEESIFRIPDTAGPILARAGLMMAGRG